MVSPFASLGAPRGDGPAHFVVAALLGRYEAVEAFGAERDATASPAPSMKRSSSWRSWSRLATAGRYHELGTSSGVDRAVTELVEALEERNVLAGFTFTLSVSSGQRAGPACA